MQTLKESILILACFLYAVVRGRAKRVPVLHTRPRVVIVQLAKLGDMVCTTPMFRAVKSAYPEAHLAVVGNRINKELLEHNDDVDEYITFEGIFPLVRQLWSVRYDMGCTTSPSVAALAALFLGGVTTLVVPKIINGSSPLETLPFRLGRVLALQKTHRMGYYAPQEYLKLLEPLGIQSRNTTKHLAYSESAKKTADAFLAPLKRPVVGISPGSGNKIKRWPVERFAEVADALVRKHDATVIVFGGVRDTDEVTDMLAYTKEPVVNTLNRFSVDELKAVVARLDLFVSVDTGPIYIAEAFTVPTVDIVGPMDEREQPPQGGRHVVVVSPGKRMPELHIMAAHPRDPSEARRQSESISTAQVLEACDKVLSECLA